MIKTQIMRWNLDVHEILRRELYTTLRSNPKLNEKIPSIDWHTHRRMRRDVQGFIVEEFR
jgi:hypothetical protein